MLWTRMLSRRTNAQHDHNAGPSEYKYWAFISYSHTDARWGRWLHHSLETYRVPYALVGKPSRDTAVPKKVYPCFLDREELPAAPSLSEDINKALMTSRCLIVICSPRAAVSRWVDAEIRTFKSLGRSDRVFCLIVDGDPNASDNPERGLLECFPKPVRFAVTGQGELLAQRVNPSAADVRPGGDGKTDALLKLVSGVLAVNFDDLRRRDWRHRLWRRVEAVTAALAVATLLSAVWYTDRLKAQAIERERMERMAELMARKTKEAIARGDEATAVFYGAHTIQYSLKANVEPMERDLLASLTLSALPDGSVPDPRFAGTLAASPDGTRVAWSRGDDTIVIWDVGARRTLTTLFGDDVGKIHAVAFDAHGKVIVTGGDDGAVRVWNAKSGAQSFVLFRSGQPVRTVAVTRQGDLIAAAGDGPVIQVWNSESKTLVQEFPGYRVRVNAVVFSPNGERLASASQDGTVRLWDIRQPTAPLQSASFLEAARSLAFSRDGNLLAIGGWDTTARLWDIASWRETAKLAVHSKSVESVAFSADDQVLATGSLDGTVQLWEVASHAKITTLSAGVQPIRAIAFVGDGHFLFAGSDDRTIRQWRIAPQRFAAAMTGHEGAVRAVEFAPGGNEIVSAGDDGTIRMWNIEDKRQIGILSAGLTPDCEDTVPERTQSEAVRALAFSYDGRFMASAGRGRCVVLWNWPKRSVIKSVRAHENWIFSIAFSPDCRTLASTGWDPGGRDNTVKLWAVPGLHQIGSSLEGHTMPVGGVAFSPTDARLLVSSSDDGMVRLWDPVTQRGRLPLVDGLDLVRPIAFSPDGNLLAWGGFINFAATLIVSSSDGLRIGDLVQGQTSGARGLIVAIPDATHITVAVISKLARFSPEILIAPKQTTTISAVVGASFGGMGPIELWDLVEGREAAILTGHHSLMVWALTFSPDGRLLASGSKSDDRQTIRLWDVAQKKLVAYLTGHHGFVLALAISRDGKLLASGGTDGTVRLWRVSDFWPTRTGEEEAGALLRPFLGSPPYSLDGAEALARKIGLMLGLEMVGTDAVPTAHLTAAH